MIPLVLAQCSLLACVEFGGAEVDESESALASDGLRTRADLPRGGYMMIPPEFEQPTEEIADVAHHARYVFYMNRSGGTFTPGINDARQNRSTVPVQTSTIQPWAVSDADWAQIMSCVQNQFSRYDVEITDVDPGAVPHFESVVAGSPQDLGLPANVGGVSPFTSDCSVIPNSIVFTFAEVFGQGNNRIVCEVIAQEVAHSFGLDHQYLCEDPMTYLTGCGAKTFQNTDAQCGEDTPRTCACGQATQNSVAMLSARLGLTPDDAILPSVAITSPPDGSIVGPGFPVNVDASDNIGISKVDLLIDGVLVATDTTAPFSFTTDPALARGTHVIETVAEDGQNSSSVSIAITLDEDADPNNPQMPDDPQSPGSNGQEYVTGGCSTTGTGGPSGLLLIGLALVSLRRRRRVR